MKMSFPISSSKSKMNFLRNKDFLFFEFREYVNPTLRPNT